MGTPVRRTSCGPPEKHGAAGGQRRDIDPAGEEEQRAAAPDDPSRGLARETHEPPTGRQAGDPAARQQGARCHLGPGDTPSHGRRHRPEEQAEHRDEGQAREQLEQQRGHHPAWADVVGAVEDVAERGHRQQQRDYHRHQ